MTVAELGSAKGGVGFERHGRIRDQSTDFYPIQPQHRTSDPRTNASVIPHRANVRDKPHFFPKKLYKLGARVEQLIGKAKRFKRLATPCEKTKQNYGSIVALAFIFILIKSVHTA
jgi:hypothetical protein